MHKKILKELQRVMKKHPDWRFGQITSNAVRMLYPDEMASDQFYITDERFLEALKKC